MYIIYNTFFVNLTTRHIFFIIVSVYVQDNDYSSSNITTQYTCLMRVLIAVGCTKRDISMLFKTLYISTVCTRVITAFAIAACALFKSKYTTRVVSRR